MRQGDLGRCAVWRWGAVEMWGKGALWLVRRGAGPPGVAPWGWWVVE